MPPRPKNILLLWTDQQRPDTLGAYGNADIQTPALDRLAASSCLFERAYAAEPVCTPSRATVLTGLYPHTHGVVANGEVLSRDVPTLAELLRPTGYTCGYVGKWHLGDEVRPQRGFEQFWSSTEDRYTEDAESGARSAYYDFLVERGYASKGGGPLSRAEAVALPEEVGKPAFQAQECIRFIESNRDRPFFLSCNFLEPHHPYFGPFHDHYRPQAMALPESWYGDFEETVPLRFRLRRQHYVEGWANTLPPGFADEALQWKTAKAWYWGQCSLVDKYAGRILQRLEELGLADDTVVVYTSDHGDMMGEHHMHQKGMPFEGSSRVPLMIRAPGLSPRRLSTPASLVHIVPTVLDLIGQPLPPHLQGTSLRPLLEAGDTAPEQTDLVIEWNGPFAIQHLARLRDEGHVDASPDDPRLTKVMCRTIRRGHWKLSLHESGEHELYDLEADPGETHNAFWDPGMEDVIASLTDRLRAWQRESGDDFVLPNATR